MLSRDRPVLRRFAAGLVLSWLGAAMPAYCQPPTAGFEWQHLPDLPQPLSGHAVGASHGALVVAGGTDFPTPLFQGGAKAWFDGIHILEPRAPGWRTMARLPHPLAYAAVASVDNRLIVAGGADSTRHFSDVHALEWVNGELRHSTLPPLPAPLAMATGAVVGRTFFVVGGQAEPTSGEALATVWTLDLSAASPVWRTIEPVPGGGRILPVVSGQAGRLHVFSGAGLNRDSAGTIVRRYLTDAYSWRDGEGWRRLSDLPAPVAAAPSAPLGQSHVIVFGGDSGADAHRIWELKDEHPGFSRTVLAYHTITDTWSRIGEMSRGVVTTTAVSWDDRIVVAGGEDRPGHRVSDVFGARLASTGRTFGALDYAVLVAYFVPLLFIGRYFAQRTTSTTDYFLGGRRVPWWAAGLSIYGTQLSAITFLAIPAKAYAEDWVFFLGNVCIVLVAPFVVHFYIPFFRGLSLTTAYEYLERRFDVTVRLVGSCSFVLLQVARMAVVLFLPALMLSSVAGVNVYASILAMGVLCTLYTLLGGMRAVIWTDVTQVFVLLGAALVTLLIIVFRVEGGFPGIWQVASAAGKLQMLNWTWDATVASVWVVVVGNLLANLVPYTADQVVIQRYLTTPDERAAARAVWSGALLTFPTSILFFSVGTALYAFYRAHPEALNPTIATDATFSWFIGQQLPAGVSGLAVAGVFAAAMSTLSSGISSITTAIVVDVQARFRPSSSDRDRMKLARLLTGVVGGVGTGSAMLLATWQVASLWDTFLRSLGLFGGGLAGVFALGVFTTRASARGALIGLAAGAVVLFFVQKYTSVHFFLYAGIGMITCVTVGYLTSLLLSTERRSLEGLTVYSRGLEV